MVDSDDLFKYYSEHFPVQSLCHMLSVDYPLRLREFSFTLQNGVYTRFRSYSNWNELSDEIKKTMPSKIDAGAVYSIAPSSRKSNDDKEFFVTAREIVFDLDISDYDDLRVCCKEKSICKNCWPLLAASATILDDVLKSKCLLSRRFWI